MNRLYLTGSRPCGVDSLEHCQGSHRCLWPTQCHLTDSIKRLLRNFCTELVIILEGVTSQLQLLDVCLNKPFKDHIKCLYME